MDKPTTQQLENQLQDLLTKWARLTNKSSYIADSIDAEIERINKLLKENK